MPQQNQALLNQDMNQSLNCLNDRSKSWRIILLFSNAQNHSSLNLANLFQLPEPLPAEECFEPLLQTDRLRVERIVSVGHATPIGQWYDQPRDEWVVLLQGEAQLIFEQVVFEQRPIGEANPRKVVDLKPGDYLLIPAHHKHRVESTSTEPPCIWLAIHYA
jgi:cupin 2 domain-containing protein